MKMMMMFSSFLPPRYPTTKWLPCFMLLALSLLFSTTTTTTLAFSPPDPIRSGSSSSSTSTAPTMRVLVSLEAVKQKASRRRQDKIESLTQWASSVAKIASRSDSVQLSGDDFGGLGWFANINSNTNTKIIPPGSVLLTVPSNVALSVECPGSGPDDDQVWQLVNDKKALRAMPWFVQMSLYLFKLTRVDSMKNAAVDLQPWLDSLPRQDELDDNITPIHWSDDCRRQLQYRFLQDAVRRQEQTWRLYHTQLTSIMTTTTTGGNDGAKLPPLLTWSDFLWGCECARSRAFSGTYTGGAFNPLIYAFTLLLVTAYVGLGLGTVEQAANGAAVVVCASILKDFVVPKLLKTKKYVICPMIDMANHQSLAAKAVVSFEFFANAYSLAIDKSSSSIGPGEQIYISYGARSNDQLLQYYGFVEKDNPHDVYIMPPLREWDIGALEMACGRQFAAGRLEKLDRAGLLGSAGTTTTADDVGNDNDALNLAGGVVVTRVLGLDPAVLQALRALVSTDAEWDAAGQAIGNFAQETSGGAENERCARLAARKAIEMELLAKETTVEEDCELLKRMETMKGLNTSRADILAVQFRIEKKKLLKETIQKLAS